MIGEQATVPAEAWDMDCDDAVIATAEELEHFSSSRDPPAPITPQIRGAIAETALTGLVRYPWSLLAPVLHRLLDSALDAFPSEGEIGPPRPMLDDLSEEASRASLHAALSQFQAPPFTLQRICEVLLEPQKQYSRADKLALAIERLLLVSSTITLAAAPPPPPALASLGAVNENPPSPYAGQPPAGPAAQHEGPGGPHSMHNGLGMGSDEYAIFVGAEASPAGGGALSPSLGSEGQRSPPPMAPAEVLQAEAFAEAALASVEPDGGCAPAGKATAEAATAQSPVSVPDSPVNGSELRQDQIGGNGGGGGAEVPAEEKLRQEQLENATAAEAVAVEQQGTAAEGSEAAGRFASENRTSPNEFLL